MTEQARPVASTKAAASPADPQPALVVESVTKAYGSAASHKTVLADLSLTVHDGEFVCIVGPSGAGKSTLLRCLAGLMAPTSGSIHVKGRPVTGPPDDVAVVFQDYSRSLLPWLTAEKNVALPLQGKGVDKTTRLARAREALATVGLADAAGKHPAELSGGMQQRVSIARGIAYEPDILLMDEPFASVDAQTRADLEDLVVQLRSTLGMTIVLVTHDIDEAVYLSDRIVVIAGSPASVVDVVETGFGTERDQLTTKADPRFNDYRARVLTTIRGPRR